MFDETTAADSLNFIKARFAGFDYEKKRRIVQTLAGIQGQKLTHDEINNAIENMTEFLNSKYAVMGLAGRDRIDQRTIEQLHRTMKYDRLPNGVIQQYLPNEKSLIVFPKKKNWRPQEAALAMKRMTEFYESPYGLLANCETLIRTYGTLSKQELESTVRQHTAMLHTFWSDPETIVLLAYDPFLEMMKAAAIDAPDKQLSFDELPSPRGVIFFQREQKISGIEEFYPARGISWLIHDDMIFIQVLVDGHHEADSPAENGIEPTRENYSCLYVRSVLRTAPDNPDLVGHIGTRLLQLIRSIRAISRSAHTRAEDKSVQVNVKRCKGRKRQLIEGSVRVLSLHNPEYGRYELDAATGRHLRQHWVRGHWRNQWYPSEQINQTIWIDGFVRGDASIGVLAGQKIYVARGTDPDQQEDEE